MWTIGRRSKWSLTKVRRRSNWSLSNLSAMIQSREPSTHGKFCPMCTQHDAICTILFMVLCRAAIRCVNHGRNKANRLRDRQLRPKQRMNQLGMTSQTSSPGQPELAVLAVLAESGGIWRGRSLFFFRWNLPLSSDPSCASESTTKASGSAFLSVHSSVRPSVRLSLLGSDKPLVADLRRSALPRAGLLRE